VARVDFHSQVGDKHRYTCRLARKIFSLAAQEQVLKKIVVVGAQSDLEKLDELLWSFSAEDFLPHCYLEDEAASFTPIVLATVFEETQFEQIPHQDVFIHLGQEFLSDIEKITNRFERVIEVVSMEEEDVLAGRARYKQYRTMGLELFNHDQKGAR
jgi:DNA polymerase-3 subunit chi